MNTVDCKSEEGIIIGLIDSIMTICAVLKTKDLDLSRQVQEALMDLRLDKDLKYLLKSAEELIYSKSMSAEGFY